MTLLDNNPHLRLAIKPTSREHGYVDGAWWPHSDDLEAELPDLLAGAAATLGPITRVIYHLDGWPRRLPRRLRVEHRTIRLGGFHYQPADTVELIGANRARIVLLVIPAATEPAAANTVLHAASDDRNVATTAELLQLQRTSQPGPVAVGAK